MSQRSFTFTSSSTSRTYRFSSIPRPSAAADTGDHYCNLPSQQPVSPSATASDHRCCNPFVAAAGVAAFDSPPATAAATSRRSSWRCCSRSPLLQPANAAVDVAAAGSPPATAAATPCSSSRCCCSRLAIGPRCYSLPPQQPVRRRPLLPQPLVTAADLTASDTSCTRRRSTRR